MRVGYAAGVSEIQSSNVVAFYLFDVAESADLPKVPALIGGPTVPARLAPKPATPPYVQYDKPPLSFEGEALGVPEIDGFRTRVRVYDYGVVSVALIASVRRHMGGLCRTRSAVHRKRRTRAARRAALSRRDRPAAMPH